MPQFILIDNSISDSSGHHYQYAAFCLQAAKELGYTPILVTNKKNKETQNLQWKVYPEYTGTFWNHEEYHSFLMSLYKKFESSKNKALLSGILKILGPLLIKKLLDKNKIDEFAKNTQELFRKVNLAKGDIVFLPTSGLVEMFGISQCARNNPSLNMASWHFLFRRNLYHGSPENYSFMYIKLRLLKLAFDNFLKNSKINSFFYTDSDQLTVQFDEIKSVKFHTLPIPHTMPRSETKTKNDKIIITYLGDARTEKGYQYLPSLIQDLWLDYLKNDKISFVIQSNYNIPEGEPSAVVARAELQSFPNDKVKLILNSPDSIEYQQILQDSDIVLLPYDKTNYYARSSGILAEALAMGKPVIVPAGTWLSRQFVSETYKYHYSLKELSQSTNTPDIRYENGKKPKGNFNLSWDVPAGHCWFRIPKNSTYVLVTVYFSKENTSSAVILHCTQLRANGKNTYPFVSYPSFLEKTELPYATLLIPILPTAEKIWLGFKHPYTESTVSIDKVNIDFLDVNLSTYDIPLSSVGIIYDSVDQIRTKLKNMINNYDHYLDTARKFSDNYYKKHNAKELIKVLINSNNEGGLKTE